MNDYGLPSRHEVSTARHRGSTSSARRRNPHRRRGAASAARGGQVDDGVGGRERVQVPGACLMREERWITGNRLIASRMRPCAKYAAPCRPDEGAQAQGEEPLLRKRQGQGEPQGRGCPIQGEPPRGAQRIQPQLLPWAHKEYFAEYQRKNIEQGRLHD